MKRNTQFILILMIISVLILSACGGGATGQVNAMPNADQLMEFNEQGIAVLRGNLAGESATAVPGGKVNVNINVKMDGLQAAVSIPFTLRNETILSSTLVEKTDLLEYVSFNKGSNLTRAFPASALVDVTFRKSGTGFDAIGIVEVTKKGLFNRTPSIAPFFSSDVFTPVSLQGRITQSSQDLRGDMHWIISFPMWIQGREAAVLLPVTSELDTEAISRTGDAVLLDGISGAVEVTFVRTGDKLLAREIKELP
jgi:hypothetical protein